MFPLTPYPVTPIGSFIGFVLSAIPFVLHLSSQSLNTGIWMAAFWIGIMNFVNFVNTIVWHDNVDTVIPVWCDIVTKLQVAATVGIPACDVVLYLHLVKITRMRAVVFVDEKAQRRRALILDLALTLGLPVLMIVPCLVMSPNRFEIAEEIGCQPLAIGVATYITMGLSNVLYLTAAGLSPFILHRLIRHRREMNEALASSSDITPNKCIRVMIVASTILLLNLPLVIIRDVVTISRLWSHGFNYVGSDGSPGVVPPNRIIVVTAQKWDSDKWQFFAVKWTEWYYVLEAIIFFLIFGTTSEARRRYCTILSRALVKIGLREKRSPAVLPAIMFRTSHARRPPVRRGTLSFLDSSMNSRGHSTLSVHSIALAQPEEGHKAMSTTIGSVKRNEDEIVVKDSEPLHNSVQVSIPESAIVDTDKQQGGIPNDNAKY